MQRKLGSKSVNLFSGFIMTILRQTAAKKFHVMLTTNDS